MEVLARPGGLASLKGAKRLSFEFRKPVLARLLERRWLFSRNTNLEAIWIDPSVQLAIGGT